LGHPSYKAAEEAERVGIKEMDKEGETSSKYTVCIYGIITRKPP
jgi:hypothetical protein